MHLKVCQFYLFKKANLVLLLFFIVFLICIVFTSALIFITSHLLLALGFVYSSFSSCLICKFRLFIWDLFCLLIQAFMSTTFLASHKFVMLSSCSHLCLSTFYFSFYFIFWRTGCLKMCCLLLWIFQFFLCYWFLILFYCGQRIYFVWYLSF